MPFQKKYSFPVRKENVFEFLVDGEQYFEEMLGSIHTAKKTILFEQYLVTTCNIGKEFIRALSNAIQRGVEVYCLFDDYGSRGLNQYSRQQLINLGIHLSFYNPIKFKKWQSALFRDHRKLLLIDSSVAFVGGAGITDDFISQNNKPAWHDIMLKIQGGVIADWYLVFQRVWQESSTIPIAPYQPVPVPEKATQTGQVLVNHPWHQEFNRMVLNKIQHAAQHIWITTPYFVPSWKLRRRLRRMSDFGIDVRLLLTGELSDHPWVTHAARRYYTKLLKHGIRIFEYQPRFTHAKVILCDNWFSVGSSNLDRWNQHWNLDANQAVEDEPLSAVARKIFLDDFDQSNEIILADWLQRSPWQRWRESYAGYLILILEKLSRFLPSRRKS